MVNAIGRLLVISTDYLPISVF